jgi:large subunit ribosomal protein L10
VVKNSFLKRAMADSGFPDVGEKLTGQTAVVTGEKDVAPVAKILKAFAAEFKTTALKIGLIDRAIVSTAEVEQLADLPSREVLLGQLLGLLLAPATRLVRVLNEPASAFARLLKARADKMPAPEPVKAETPAPAPEVKEAPVEAAATQESPVAEAKVESPATEEPKKEEPPAPEAAG